jgi:uncharacterized protein (TIRG00374 family)
MKKSYKKQLLNIAFVLLLAGITLLVLYFSGDDLNVDYLREILSECNGWLVAAAVGCMLLYSVFEALALRIIMHRFGYRRKFTSFLAYSSSDVYYSGITPSATGGQPASAFYMIRDGIPGGTACFGLVFNLVGYTAALLLLGIVILSLNFTMFLGFSLWVKVFIILGFLSQLSLLLVFIGCIVRPGVVLRIGNFCVSLLSKIRIVKNVEKWRGKVTEAVEKYRGCFECFKNHRGLFAEVLLCNMAQRISLITVSAFVCMSMTDCSMWQMFSMQTFAMIGYNSIPLPGGSGAFEFLYINIYGGVFAPEFTLVAMMITRVISYYLSILVNGIYTMLYHVLAPSVKKDSGDTDVTLNEKRGSNDEKT